MESTFDFGSTAPSTLPARLVSRVNVIVMMSPTLTQKKWIKYVGRKFLVHSQSAAEQLKAGRIRIVVAIKAGILKLEVAIAVNRL
jgi:hypothetical protein